MRRWPRVMMTMAMLMIGRGAAAQEPADSLAFAPQLGIDLAAMEPRDGGLLIRDVREGEGPTVRRGDDVAVRYVGWLPDGTLFDAVVPPNAPKEFRLGDREVIRGWEQGILGMRVGGQRQIIVPPSLAYGCRRVANIPPNSTLIFLVELVSAR